VVVLVLRVSLLTELVVVEPVVTRHLFLVQLSQLAVRFNQYLISNTAQLTQLLWVLVVLLVHLTATATSVLHHP
jgi:hypothetical protein